MKKLSKILILVLSLALVFGTLVMVASADAADGYDLTASLTSATAENGIKTVKLTGNATLENMYTVKENLVIDLNGYTFTSRLDTAFLVNDDVSFSIIGKGNIVIDGILVKSADAEANPVVTIGSDASRIAITHSGYANMRIVSTLSGTFNFKNLKVVSDAAVTSGKWNALFETVHSTTAKVDMTLDGVEMTLNEKANNTFFLVSVAGTESHLTIKNSALRAQSSGIFIGEAVAKDANTEVMLFENSSLVLQANYENATTWGFFLEGYNWCHEGTVGIVNVRDSFVDVAGRPFYADYDSSEFGSQSTIYLYNTTARASAATGSKHDEIFARWTQVYADSTSRIGAVNRDKNVAFNDKAKVVVSVGTRVNLLTATTKTGACGITLPDGKIATESEEYVWAYDPAGDAQYPYVLVKKSDAPANAPYYVANYGFEGILNTPVSANDDTTYGMIFQNNSAKGYADMENFKNNAEGMQFDIKAGSLYRTATVGNHYAKFVVTPTSANGTHSLSADGNFVTFGTDPYFILGGHMNYATNKAHVQADAGHTRAKVAVLDFDFGTDSNIGYPYLNVATQCRRTSGGSASQGAAPFDINPDGTIVPAADLMNANASLKLNPAGEWNHVTVVFYTDPALNGNKGIAHFYINGEYLGNAKAYANAAESYIMGLRFNIKKVAQPLDASICFDNVSLKAYSDFLFDGEADASGSTAGNYLHANYVTDSPALKYIRNTFSVGGFVSNGDVNDAIKSAAANGSEVDLLCDLKNPTLVTEEGTIVTNGYELNLDPDSIACMINYDENGNPAKYTFNKKFAGFKVKYYWYTGAAGNLSQMKNDDYYAKTEFSLGQMPSTDAEIVEFIATGNNEFKQFAGWSTSSNATEPENIEAVSISFAVAQGTNPVYLYPVYVKANPKAYVLNSAGDVVGMSASDTDTKNLYRNLKNGQTLVLLDNFVMDISNVRFDNPAINHGVTIDNNYTAAELETMKNASAKIAVDVNGYEWLMNVSGTIAQVSRNTTLTIYSSRPGGYIHSRAYKTDTSLYGQRMFAIFGGTENVNQKGNVYNAHINIGTTTIDGKTYPGSNLTLNGGVILEGMVGDNSCSINADGILALRGHNDSSGMIMTRFYDGDIIVKNSIFVGPHTNNLIDLKSYDNGNKAANGRQSGYENVIMTPYVLLENSIFINNNTASSGNAGSLVGNNGDYKDNKNLEFKNFITNGRLNGSNEPSRNFVGTGVGAYNYAIGTNAPYEKAYYNVPMTLNMFGTYAEGDSHILAVKSPAAVSGGVNDNRYYYIVDQGYEHLVPEDNIGYLVLPTIEKISANADEGTIHTVTVKNFDGSIYATRKYATGGNPVGLEIVPDQKIGSFTMSHDGTFTTELPGGIQGATTLVPNYTVKASLSGVKTNLSLHSDFGLNIFVPATYKDQIVSVTCDKAEGELVGVDTVYNGSSFVVYTVPVAANEVAEDVVFCVTLRDESNVELGTLEGSENITVSFISYAEKILANAGAFYEEADRTMLWYAVNYANEAYKYFGGSANAELAKLLTDYADAKNTAERVYANVLDNMGLDSVFTAATLRLTDVPAYSFTVKAGFAGTVNVTTSLGTYTFEVEASETPTKLVIEGMKAYEFAETAAITASGTIGEEAVVVDAGQFNLATFAAYHSGNADASAASAEALDLINALYDYVSEAKTYADSKN